MNAFKVQCDFISGSDAQGCLVVLVGKFDNITMNLERNNPCTIEEVLNATFPLSSYYTTVYGFDIEMDGSEGNLAIPGELITDMSDLVCSSSTTSKMHTSEFPV